jgi:hypothetical protein
MKFETISLDTEVPVVVKMIAPGSPHPRNRGQKNRGRLFIVAMVLIFLIFNCRNLVQSDRPFERMKSNRFLHTGLQKHYKSVAFTRLLP